MELKWESVHPAFRWSCAALVLSLAVPLMAEGIGDADPSAKGPALAAPTCDPNHPYENWDGGPKIGGVPLIGWWMILGSAAVLLAVAIGWLIPWRLIRIPLALLVAVPAWLAGGICGDSIGGLLPMMGACFIGAVFWPVVTIGLTELFHYVRATGKKMSDGRRAVMMRQRGSQDT